MIVVAGGDGTLQEVRLLSSAKPLRFEDGAGGRKLAREPWHTVGMV